MNEAIPSGPERDAAHEVHVLMDSLINTAIQDVMSRYFQTENPHHRVASAMAKGKPANRGAVAGGRVRAHLDHSRPMSKHGAELGTRHPCCCIYTTDKEKHR